MSVGPTRNREIKMKDFLNHKDMPTKTENKQLNCIDSKSLPQPRKLEYAIHKLEMATKKQVQILLGPKAGA